MSYSFKSKDEPVSKIYFLDKNNKICSADIIEVEGGSMLNTNIFDLRNNALNATSSAPPNVLKLLQKYGDAQIQYIKINRTPVQSGIQKALGFLSKNNNFENELKKMPYDTLYHLQMIISTNKGRVCIEKNERINMSEKPVETETINVKFPSGLTIQQIYDNGIKYAGSSKFYGYSVSNNCQMFIMYLLSGSNLNTPENVAFTKQDTSSLFKNDVKLRKFANSMTKIGAVINSTMNGGELQIKKRGRPKKYYID